MSAAKFFSSSSFSWLYPSRCALCSLLGDEPICPTCLQEFRPVDVVRTYHGGELELAATLFAYEGRVAQAVRRLKYGRATFLAAPLAASISEGLQRLGFTEYDLVVPIPIHWSRRCMRGFNQSELLCEGLERVVPNGLRRIRRTKPQVGLSREERLSNLEGAFRASTIVAGKDVLLVDDVFTSGQTARECARALREAGATRVASLALAGEALDHRDHQISAPLSY